MRLLILGASLAVFVSCTKSNPNFCSSDNDCDGTCDVDRGVCNETDASVPDAETPDAATCVTQTDCTNPAAPVCDPSDMVCRGCSPAGVSQECVDIDMDRGVCNDDGRCGECSATSGCEITSLTPVCELSTLDCRGCQSSTECTDSTRDVCAADGRCVECATHADCSSEVCDIPQGTCVAASAVLYVGGNNATDVASCGAASAPCATIQFGVGRVAAQTHVRIRDGNYSGNVDLDNLDLTLVGPGADLASLANSVPTVRVRNGSNAVIDGLTIRGATMGAAGVDCSGSSTSLTFVRARSFFNMGPGIESDDCALTVLESTIDANTSIGMLVTNGTLVLRRSTIHGNSNGGLHVVLAPYEIINNFVYDNGRGGSGGSDIGGMKFDNSAESGDQTLAFNTIAENRARTGVTSGVDCDVSGGATSVVTSNIVYNGSGGSVVAGSCVWSFSNYEGAPVGTRDNIDSNPMFVNPTNGDFKLEPGSPCKDKAEDLAAVTIDHGGQARPAGAKDIGADEIDP